MAKNQPAGGALAGIPSHVQEQIDRRIAKAEAEAGPDVFAGADEDTEQAEEQAYLQASETAAFEARRDQAASDRIAELERKLERQAALLEKLSTQAQVHSLSRAVREEKRQAMQAARRRIYERVKQQGNQVLINIFPDPTDPYNRPVDVRINGHHWRLERGRPITVSAQVLEVLDNAVQDAYLKFRAEDGTVTHQHVFKQSFPYNIIDPALAVYQDAAFVATEKPSFV